MGRGGSGSTLTLNKEPADREAGKNLISFQISATGNPIKGKISSKLLCDVKSFKLTSL